jgi:hypothetical protein
MMDARQILLVSGDLDKGARKFLWSSDLANRARAMSLVIMTSPMMSLESSSERSFVESGMTSRSEDEMAVLDDGKGTLKICNSSVKLTAFGSMMCGGESVT